MLGTAICLYCSKCSSGRINDHNSRLSRCAGYPPEAACILRSRSPLSPAQTLSCYFCAQQCCFVLANATLENIVWSIYNFPKLCCQFTSLTKLEKPIVHFWGRKIACAVKQYVVSELSACYCLLDISWNFTLLNTTTHPPDLRRKATGFIMKRVASACEACRFGISGE